MIISSVLFLYNWHICCKISHFLSCPKYGKYKNMPKIFAEKWIFMEVSYSTLYIWSEYIRGCCCSFFKLKAKVGKLRALNKSNHAEIAQCTHMAPLRSLKSSVNNGYLAGHTVAQPKYCNTEMKGLCWHLKNWARKASAVCWANETEIPFKCPINSGFGSFGWSSLKVSGQKRRLFRVYIIIFGFQTSLYSILVFSE